MKELFSKIQSMNLTKTEKIIADYIIDNINTIGLDTVTDLSMKIGVSDTSIIRFIRLLGFSGFTDFKKTMNERMLKQYNDALSPSQKFNNTNQKINNDSLLSDVFYKSIDNLTNTMLSLNDEIINTITDCIIQSENKYVVAFRGTSCCAEYFTRKALFFLPHFILCDKAESSTIEKMIDITDRDCVIMFSFPRYSEINFAILKIAKERHAKIIIITDRVTSPLAPFADYLLTVNIEGVGFTNSYVAPLCLAEALAILIGQKVGKQSSKRLNILDKYINNSGLY